MQAASEGLPAHALSLLPARNRGRLLCSSRAHHYVTPDAGVRVDAWIPLPTAMLGLVEVLECTTRAAGIRNHAFIVCDPNGAGTLTPAGRRCPASGV